MNEGDYQRAPIQTCIGIDSPELPTDRLWEVSHVALCLGLSTGTIYKMVARGDLPRVPGMTKRLRFFPRQILAFLRGEAIT